ncbi:MAG: peptidoglycan DD-metalloendopeptidase family protein, partial [Gammaproteobacteria bacterium]
AAVAPDAPQVYVTAKTFAIALPVLDGQREMALRDDDVRLPFEPLVARAASSVENAGQEGDEWINVTVAPGDNLSLIFSRLKLSKNDLHELVTLDGKERKLRNLKPGQLIRILIRAERLDGFVIELDPLNSLHFERGDDGFKRSLETATPEVQVAAATTEITHSLFLDGQKAGLADTTIMQLTEIFGWDIDFALDIRAHDRFSVIYEEIYKDGELIKPGRILAAEFLNKGKTHRAVLYENAAGDSSYYSEDGKAMRKAFLRTPVNFTRISSKFNLQRRHPILNTIRAHRGVDYAAPHGTPVRATANGAVRMAGSNRGYGLSVELQHGSAYRTLYAHLSRFAKGIKRGVSVRQGQVIGYVGKTGLATGPHLHYEFRVNGVHRNPLTIELPKS